MVLASEDLFVSFTEVKKNKMYSVVSIKRTITKCRVEIRKRGLRMILLFLSWVPVKW